MYVITEQVQKVKSGASEPLPLDPIETAFSDVAVPVEKFPNDMREGICLLFHGAPNTSILSYLKMATYQYLIF